MSAQCLHVSTPAALARVAVVLVRPSHPGNVGACARAMRVMGLRELSIVAPRHAGVNAHADAVAFASHALDVLEAARSFDSLESAVADATLVIGVSAEPREFAPEPREPEIAAREALDELEANEQHRVAFVFGTERTGLSVAESQRCQSLCAIPGEPGYHSLNLSQAVQLIAYVLRREALSRVARPTRAPPSSHAAQASVEALFEHLERALVAIGCLDPSHPKKLMPRLRRLFGRARLEPEEVELLRGVCTEAERTAARARQGAR
ncbi:MAG: RNA methyltransferase [Burkholderiaceae bacterium]|nr:RNA methyltransferase [Burkholderiaceae bacterium]